MFKFSPEDYGNMAADLLRSSQCNELGPGTPHRATKLALEMMTDESLLAPHAVADEQMGAACRSGLWLRHDFLEKSHRISQTIDTPTGSFWHGIMHRREPDPSNAKYWFRKVGDHPVFDSLRDAAAGLALENRHADDWDDAADFLVDQTQWDPIAWIDLCDQARTGHISCKRLCRTIQQCEWQLLFDFCYHRAIAE